MLANVIVTNAPTINWNMLLTSIGSTVVVLFCIIAIAGFFYIWITAAEIKDVVDDIYEIVDDDENEKTTKKEKSNDE